MVSGLIRWTAAVIVAACSYSSAQTLLNGVGSNLQIIGSDMAVLETQEIRKDLPCTVVPSKPVLGFDLRFHAGYDVTVPLDELGTNENAQGAPAGEDSGDVRRG